MARNSIQKKCRNVIFTQTLFNLFSGCYYDLCHANGEFYIYEANSGIWRKRVDKEDPELWLEIVGNYNCNGRTLRRALKGDALAISKKCKKIIIISTKNSEEERQLLEIKNDYGEDVVDHRVFGDLEDHLVLLTEDGWIVAFRFDLKTRTVHTKDRLQIGLNSEREEQGLTLSVCPDSRFFAVHLCGVNCRGSRLLLFEFKDDLFTKRAEVDIGKENLKRFWAMDFYRYFGDHLFLTAISCDEKQPTVLTYSFNRKTGGFREFRDMRKEISAKWPFKLITLEDRVVSSDNHARLINVTYTQ